MITEKRNRLFSFIGRRTSGAVITGMNKPGQDMKWNLLRDGHVMPLQEKVTMQSCAHTELACMVAGSTSSNSGRPFKTDLYIQ